MPDRTAAAPLRRAVVIPPDGSDPPRPHTRRTVRPTRPVPSPEARAAHDDHPRFGRQAPIGIRPEWPSGRTPSSPEAAGRLLDQASDPQRTLAGRIGLLSRSGTALDEWFQGQAVGPGWAVTPGPALPWSVGTARVDRASPVTGLVNGIVQRQSALVRDELLPGLAGAGVVVVDLQEVDEPGRDFLSRTFDRTIFPILTPLAVDHGHPFPYISNLSLNLVVEVHYARTGGTRVARVKIPTLLPRFVALPDGIRVVPVEQVVAAHVGTLFPSVTVLGTHAFRVTRTAVSESVAEPLGPVPGPVGHGLHRRRFGEAVRLEVAAGIAPDLLRVVVGGVGVPESGVFQVTGLVDPGALAVLIPAARPGAAGAPAPAAPRTTSPRRPDPWSALPVVGGVRVPGGSGALRALDALRALHARLLRRSR